MTSAFIPFGLAFIMLTVGLGLGGGDFRTLARRPGPVAVGLGAQLVMLPLAAFAVAWAFALPPLSALGLILVACVPGGVTSNFVTVLARGDTAMSVVLTAASTGLGVVTVPLVLAVAAATFDAAVGLPVRLPLGETALAVLLITALPMALGMGLRASNPRLAARWLRPARQAATAVFAGIVVVAFAADWDVVEAEWRTVGPPVLAFNALAVLIGLGLGRAFGLGPRATLTLGVEAGLQNVALALFLGGSVLGAPALMVPAAIYVLAMNASALVLIAYGRRLESAALAVAPVSRSRGAGRGSDRRA